MHKQTKPGGKELDFSCFKLVLDLTCLLRLGFRRLIYHGGLDVESTSQVASNYTTDNPMMLAWW